jgi:rubrerythrin
MVNFEKISNKIIWCKNCDYPVYNKDKKCPKCGITLNNFKMKLHKKHFNPIKFNEFQRV